MLPDFYQRYIDTAGEGNLVRLLILEGDKMATFYRSLPPHKLEYRYEEGKWTPMEILGHIIDCERIFSFRALSFARIDKREIIGFEQDDYIPEMNIENRSFINILNELVNLRASTIDLFSSFSTEMMERGGIASSLEVSVEQLGRMIVGHEKWHRNIIKERYL